MGRRKWLYRTLRRLAAITFVILPDKWEKVAVRNAAEVGRRQQKRASDPIGTQQYEGMQENGSKTLR